MEIKVLDPSHETQIIELVKKKNKFSHQSLTTDVFNNLCLGIKKSLSSKTRYRIIGCLVDNEVKAIVSQTFDTEHPFWYMDYFVSDDTTLNFNNGHGNYINECLLYAMADAESKGFFEIYYSVPIQYIRTQKKTHSSSPAWSRYDIYIERIIKSNQFPENHVHKAVYGTVLKPHEVVIKKAILKNDLRNELLKELK